MRHIKKPVWEKRIPTVFALLLVVGSVFLTAQFLQQQTSTRGRASQTTTPTTIEITNITDTSFSVAFATSKPAVAGIRVSGPNMIDSVFFSTTNQEALVTHAITVPNLTPDTQYTFSVLVEGETILNNNQPFSVMTATPLETNDSVSTASGIVVTPDGSQASNVLVVISSNESQTLSTLTNDVGEYSFNLANIRTTDLQKYATFTNDSLFTLRVYFKDQSSRIEIPYKNLREIPTITLSQNYSFDYQAPPIQSATNTAELRIPEPSTRASSALAVSSPREGQSLLDERPILRGTAVPNSPVVVHINNRITESTVSNASGRWELRPVNPLPQGENTFIIQSKDALGVQRSVTRTVEVFASGMQVAQTATPSATLTPTRSASPTNTPTPTLTIAPTTTVSPTPQTAITETPTPTATATPTLVVTNTPIPTTPPILTVTPTPPGSITTAVVTIASVILIVTGSVLLFILG